MSFPQDDFDKLRQMLVCKRYEQPPPGYFNAFSDKVVARLEAEELLEYSSWWQWLVDKFDAKPIVACVYGCVVSGLLLAGFRLSQVFENEAASAPLPGGPSWLGLASTSASSAITTSEMGQSSVLGSPSSALSAPEGLVFRGNPQNFLFDRNPLGTHSLSFSTGGF